MKELNKKELERLVQIARENIIGLEDRVDLEAHHSDDEDFFEVSVWELKKALIAAYQLGRQSNS